ncbi:Proteasome subunit beta type-1 [Dionaea muscipula]
MGCVFTYDAVGSYERVGYSSRGSGAKLIMPFLDNQLKSPSPLLLPVAGCCVTPLSEIESVDLVKTAFASATERDMYTQYGDLSMQLGSCDSKEGISRSWIRDTCGIHCRRGMS